MSIQYQDKTFSENMPFNETFEKFQEEMVRVVNPARSLHVGTEDELEEIKTEKSLEFRVSELEEMIESLTPEKPSLISKPSKEQIEHIAEAAV